MIDCGNQIDTQTHNKVVNIFSLLLFIVDLNDDGIEILFFESIIP